MNADSPAWLQAQIRSHNRQALWLAALSLAAAVLAWNLAYFFFVLILLGLVTSVRGDFGPQMPGWIPGTALSLAIALLIWGVADHLHRRYSGMPDRGIIGWHLFADFFLLPVRLTFAIWGNFSAVRRLSDEELARAWELLQQIQRDGKGHLRSLSLIEPDSDQLYRLLQTLQMVDLIDLHRGEEGWFYTVRSTRREELGRLPAPGDKKY